MSQDPPLDPTDNQNAAPKLSYKGSLAGLRGLLSTRINQSVQSVGLAFDRVVEIAQAAKLQEAAGTQPLAIEEIFPCADQPRQIFDPKALEELAQTMRELGQAQAITVRRVATGYEIISGERRYRAAKLAGLKTLDCVVRDCTPAEARLLALVENTQRQDLLPLEEALFLKRILDENPKLSLEKLARALGSHKSTLSEKIQLTEIPADLQSLLLAKGRSFTHRHWRVVSRVPDEDRKKELVSKALEYQLSVAELERAVGALGVQKSPRRRSVESAGQRSPWIRVDGNMIKIRSLSVDLNQISADDRERLLSDLEALMQKLAPVGNGVSPSASA